MKGDVEFEIGATTRRRTRRPARAARDRRGNRSREVAGVARPCGLMYRNMKLQTIAEMLGNLDPMNRTARAAIVCLSLVSATLLRAQAPPQTAAPTFQVSVNYVDVDVTVLDEQGRFVRDLARDDFEVFEDGKPQRIDTFSLVELPTTRPDRVRIAGRIIPSDVR